MMHKDEEHGFYLRVSKKKKKNPNCLGVSELRSLLVGLLSADVEHGNSLPSLG